MAGSRKSAAEIRQKIRSRFPGRQGEVLVEIFNALTTDIDTLESWGTALANKLNADAGVTDTNYDNTPTS